VDLPDVRQRGRGLHWSVFAFLAGFAIILALVTWGYLIPAADAAKPMFGATTVPVDRKKDLAQLRAVSWLLLAVVLVVLGGLLVLTFRVGWFFFPRPTVKRTQTRYVDAWAEAGRRVEAPPLDDGETPPADSPPSAR
jgi:hypothetical protein